MTTKHPLPEAIYLAVEAVEKSLSKKELSENEKFDINEGGVNCDGHKCGTVHCVGGWFAVALCDLNSPLNYQDGADAFAEILGFQKYMDMKYWADINRNMWGNSNGLSMFSLSMAYRNNGGRDSRTMQDVLNHWRRVAQRIEEYNASC